MRTLKSRINHESRRQCDEQTGDCLLFNKIKIREGSTIPWTWNEKSYPAWIVKLT